MLCAIKINNVKKLICTFCNSEGDRIKMNMKKLMSIGAMTLAITCCTSITTFAAENVGERKVAVSKIASKFYKGEKVINNVNITISTPIKDYATTKLTDEIKDLNIAEFNVNVGIKENLEKIIANKGNITTDPNLQKVKDFINEKLEEFIDASNDGTLAATVKEYIKVEKYGVLTTGKNMDGKVTVSLEDKSGNILLQVNSDDVKEVKGKLAEVNSWSELKEVIGNYFDINSALGK